MSFPERQGNRPRGLFRQLTRLMSLCCEKSYTELCKHAADETQYKVTIKVNAMKHFMISSYLMYNSQVD